MSDTRDARFLFGYRVGQATKLGVQISQTAYALNEAMIPSFDWLMQHVSAADLLSRLDAARGEPLPADTVPTLSGILNQQPIWAAGVTYKISEEARERESSNSTVYTRVYSAERPEIFWKTMGYDVVSSGDMIGIRYDAKWSVPEPELTLVLNGRMEVVGFTLANDMSSRDIEGANPLYLPQAKVYDNCCAIGPRIWLMPNAPAWPEVDISISIMRADRTTFSGKTSSTRLHRTLPQLVDFLGRCKQFPRGVLLMTGTGVVPGDDFTLQAGDRVAITIDPIGSMTNTVQVVGPLTR